MKSKCSTLAAVVLLLAPWAAMAAEPIVPTKKTALWNGKDFEGWTLYLKDGEGDPSSVWSVEDGILHCTGNPKGYMRTDADYADYKLHVEWRWPGKGGNNGVLVHMSEPDVVWPKSIECQLMSTNAGDFFVIGGSEFKEHAETSGAKSRKVAKRGESSEKPLGEWNEYDIICRGDVIEVRVNGALKNVATECSIQSGKICLQSEGTPIEYRNIYIEPLD